MATDLYAVIGNPVIHSQSPLIHTAFARQTHQDIVYEKILAPLQEFPQTVARFRDRGGKGANITLPFKQEAFQLANRYTERAQQAQAVNTFRFEEDGSILGDNTDGIGLVRDLTVNCQLSLKQQRILILGAGGAVRGVLGPLLAEKPAAITIANRTVSKAIELEQKFRHLGKVQGCGFAELANQGFDIIINATSIALNTFATNNSVKKNTLDSFLQLPKQFAATHAFCYDMLYGPPANLFLQWAKKHDARQCTDGLGMLVEQAAESFYLWRGITPNTAPIIQQIRALTIFSS